MFVTIPTSIHIPLIIAATVKAVPKGPLVNIADINVGTNRQNEGLIT